MVRLAGVSKPIIHPGRGPGDGRDIVGMSRAVGLARHLGESCVDIGRGLPLRGGVVKNERASTAGLGWAPRRASEGGAVLGYPEDRPGLKSERVGETGSRRLRTASSGVRS